MHHALLLAALAASPVQAQDDSAAVTDDEVGETIVVARKLEEELKDVPTSISVVTKEDIEDGGLQTIRDASDAIPNLRITEFTSRRLSFPFVRGIGSGQGDPSVITYIDGVPQFGSGGLNLPLLDVERVEFLRGPQGTLFGRNALGGLIHVITQRPAAEPTYGASLTGGNFNAQEYRIFTSGPVGDSGAGLSLAFMNSMREGYTDNLFSGDDVDDRNGSFGRAQALFRPDADSEVRVTFFGETARDGGFALSELNGLEANPHTINQDFQGVSERDLLAPSVTWQRFGDLELTSISAYHTSDILETSDFDFSPVDGVRRTTEEDQSYFYQEVRVNTPERDGEVRWLAGVSGFLSDSERSAENDIRPGGGGAFGPVGIARDAGDFDDYGIGVFGQVTVPVNDRVDVTGGLRYDYESKEADLASTFSGFPVSMGDFDESFDEVLPSASATYRHDEELTLYGLAARGFKAGGFNLNAPAGLIEFDPERNWLYEIGARRSLYDGRLGISTALYYIDWEDMQLSQFDPTTGGYVQNVGESDSKGVEIEVDVQVTDQFEVFTAFGYSDTEFDEFIDPFGLDASGNDLPFAPETTWNVGGQFTAELDDEGSRFYLRGDLTHVGEFFYDAGNREDESFALVNFRSGVRMGRWGLDVSLRNAFDEEYEPVAFPILDPTNPTVPIFFGESGAPRTLLVTLSGTL